MRTEGDFNLHADNNINFHAKKKINFTAEDNVVLNAEKYVYVMGESGILSASEKGAVRNYARDGISSFTKGTQLHGASGRIDLAGSQVHLNSVGASSAWGPGWLKPSHKKIDLQPVKVQDIVATEPINNRGVVQTKKTATTVKDSTTNKSQGVFITHEPYARAKSEKEQVREFVDTVMEAVKKANPKLNTSELSEIKSKLLKSATDVDSVIRTVKEISSLDPKVVIKATVLNELNKVADQVKQEIKDALSELKSAATDALKDAIGI